MRAQYNLLPAAHCAPAREVIFMSQNRRDFIKSSTAITLLTVSSASAAPATRNIAIFHSTRVSDQDLRCFQAGLGSSNTWQASIVKSGEAVGPYGGSHGHDVLRSFIRGKHVHLIVADRKSTPLNSSHT